MRVLDHEKLDVYQISRQLSREISAQMKRVRNKRGRADLIDQVYRATSSIPLNIAEGSGESAIARRAYFFRISRASATELAAALDHTVDMDLLEESQIGMAKELIVRIVSMLVKLTSAVTTPDSYPPLPGQRTGGRRKPKR